MESIYNIDSIKEVMQVLVDSRGSRIEDNTFRSNKEEACMYLGCTEDKLNCVLADNNVDTIYSCMIGINLVVATSEDELRRNIEEYITCRRIIKLKE